MAGIAIVALSGLVGSRLLAGADDTVRVWTVRHDLVAGQVVTPDDLVAIRVRFTDASDADRYLSAAQPPAEGPAERMVLRRDVGAGELVPRAALGPGGAGLVELPVAVNAAALPSTLDVGDLVDVWVTARGAARATQVLAAVTVLALPLERSSMTGSTEGQVVLGLDGGSATRLPEALALMADGTIVLTSRTTR
ncbi:MAG TPA: SAF domain-containing protein [Nocardioidaceae bacterium]|nr:SAF domain-containing protein [Nocardioidaceae bacterium]